MNNTLMVRPRRATRARTGHIGPIGRYVAHAERFGAEYVLETAMGDPDFAPDPIERVERLAKLAAHPGAMELCPRCDRPTFVDERVSKPPRHRCRGCERLVNPIRWRSPVPRKIAPYLIVHQGHDVTTVAILCGCSARTLRRAMEG